MVFFIALATINRVEPNFKDYAGNKTTPELKVIGQRNGMHQCYMVS